MHDAYRPIPPAKCRLELQRATGVASHHHVRPGALDVSHLAGDKIVGHLRLSQVVAACRSTADVRFGQCDKFETGNLLQQLPRRLPNTLCVDQVAGVMVCGPPGHFAGRTPQTQFGEKLGNVLHAICKIRQAPRQPPVRLPRFPRPCAGSP